MISKHIENLKNCILEDTDNVLPARMEELEKTRSFVVRVLERLNREIFVKIIEDFYRPRYEAQETIKLKSNHVYGIADTLLKELTKEE